MAPRSSKGLKTKEVKIPHLTIANKKKMETWGLGGLFAVYENRTYEDLVEELAGHSDQKVVILKYEYQGKLGTWTLEVWREVYNLPKASPGGYVMKGKIKALGVCNEATYLGPYLAYLYNHFDNKENEDSKKQKALIQTVSDSDTEMEDEKEPNEEILHRACEGEASRNKPLDQKIMVDYNDWGICLESLGRETLKLFEAFHVEVGSVTAKAMARNIKQIFALSPMAEVDI
ncbi:hypothetical protein R1flu_003784 [Riccia fluitans]|uniref:Uncharacterized protein n=1 Tax=Riccia fluitans TaxID=41844 RepID=A0ABD1Y9Y8_9MARC